MNIQSWLQYPTSYDWTPEEILAQTPIRFQHSISTDIARARTLQWERDFNARDELDLDFAYVLLTNNRFGELVTQRNSLDPTDTIAIAKIKADTLPNGNLLFQVGVHSVEQFTFFPETGIGHAILCIVLDDTVTVWNPSGGGDGMKLVADALTAALNKFPGDRHFTSGSMTAPPYTYAIQSLLHYGNNLCQSLVVLKIKDLLLNGWPGLLETFPTSDTDAFKTKYLQFSAPPADVTENHGTWAGRNFDKWLPAVYEELQKNPSTYFTLFYNHRKREFGTIFTDGYVGVAGSLKVKFEPPFIFKAAKVATEVVDKNPKIVIDFLNAQGEDIADDTLARGHVAEMIPVLLRTDAGRSAVKTYCDEVEKIIDAEEYLDEFELGKDITNSVGDRICLLVAQALKPPDGTKSKWWNHIPRPSKEFNFKKLHPYFTQIGKSSFYEMASYLFSPQFHPLATNESVVYLPDATELPTRAIHDDDNVQLVIAPRVTALAPGALSGCHNLKAVFLPQVTTIPRSAIEDCPQLKYPRSQIPEAAFIDLAY